MTLRLQDNTLQIGKENIAVKTVKGRPRTVRLSFTEDAVLLVETHSGKIGKGDWEFIETKREWLLATYHEHYAMVRKKQALLGEIEKKMLVLGIGTPVEYISSPETYYRFKKGQYFWIYAPREYIVKQKKELLFYSLRKYAEDYLARRTEYWKQVCGITFNKLRIKDMKTKWGSCSSLRNVNLNWHLILLEERLIDYIIVHELMHLHEMNHGRKFWAWVAKYLPDYKEDIKLLNERQWLVGILS